MENYTDYYPLYPDDYYYSPDDDYNRPDDDYNRPDSGAIVASVLILLSILPVCWIIWFACCKLRERALVTVFLVSLLINDTVQLITSFFAVGIKLMGISCYSSCHALLQLFILSRFCGQIFHLLVALDNIFCLSRTRSSTPPGFKLKCFFYLLSAAVWLGYIVIAFLVNVDVMNNYLCYIFLNFFGVLCTAAAACMMILKPLNPTKTSQSLKVLAVAMLTYVILYVPDSLYWIIQHYGSAWTDGFRYDYFFLYLPCLRPITDCVLCWYICRAHRIEWNEVGILPNSLTLDSSHSVVAFSNCIGGGPLGGTSNTGG
ncbi:uncharacterized protein LOC120030146 [Salvelinus namaycush]|uniref:Uncharacterized protein LOC120030146 n=1 Tax=Salvelinus namaycush TaxID=8040 RepID=A0A8U0PSS9_SALNM|nr:uncharacterized protein LOC120030146 [Salvelinus namaycush]